MNQPIKKTEMPPEEAMAKAKKDALRLLAFRARSTAELRDRLSKKKYSAEIVDEVLLFCAKQGLVDDEKFAKLYALSRIQTRPMGKKMIQFELKNKGVSSLAAERALESIKDFDEKQVALEMALRRYQHMTRLPKHISKARLFGFLKRRGFSSESVFYSLSKIYKSTESFG